jgi:hypothetical protein
MRLDGRKHPVNPDTPVDEPADPSSIPSHPDGVDPTVALFDGELSTGTTGELSLKVTTAPIDYDRNRDSAPTVAPEGGPGSDTTHIAP